MKAKEKVSFSKFFPSSQQFIVVEGKASSIDDFSINIDIGDGSEKTSFYIDNHYFKDGAAMLRAMRDAMQKSLEFYEKALKLPKMPKQEPEPLDWLFSPVSAKKPAAPKKKTTAKK